MTVTEGGEGPGTMVCNKASETSGQGGEHDRRRGAFETRKHRRWSANKRIKPWSVSFLYGFVSYERNGGALDFSLLGVLITTATT